jgi:predicted Kef-type K+ transport protein
VTATPTPDPLPPGVRDVLEVSTPGAVAFVIGVGMVLIAAVVIAFAVIRSARYPAPTALIVALSLLTLFAVAGGIASSNDEAWTIAAAGMGALAGSVTSIFQEGRYRTDTVEKAVAVVQELEKAEAEEHQEDRP